MITATVAASLVVVTVLAGCARPDQTGGTSSSAPPTSAQPVPSALPSDALRRALDCPAGIPVSVSSRVRVRTSDPGVVVVAECVPGAGSPPSGVYVVQDRGGRAQITATLVAVSQQVQVQRVTVSSDVLRVDGLGYSRPTVPRCCPDVHVSRTWLVTPRALVPRP
jgi:hypothetical protein